MSKRWALYGEQSRSLLSYRGRILVHEDRAELEFLFPENRVMECPRQYTDVMPLREHPQMQQVHFPLTKEDFKR